MRIAVVGAGPAGLTAAYRLQQLGHDVEVLEALPEVGGRTHTEHLGPGHFSDDGAGWLASFYPDTRALLGELGLARLLHAIRIRGGGDLRIDGRVVPYPSSIRRILATDLMGPLDKVRFFRWAITLFLRQPGSLVADESWDGVTALEALRPIGSTATERVVRPTFEGPFFARLEEMNGTLVRSWLRVLSVGTFYQVDGGMDAPWRAVAARVGAVRTGVRVTRIAPGGTGAILTIDGGSDERFDGVVCAVPAPLAARLVERPAAPPWLGDVEYVPHVRLYAARRAAGPDRSGIHAFPNDDVATVEIGGGRFGAWGKVPVGWQWALVCAPSATSAKFMRMSDEATKARLWDAAAAIDPRLFDLASAEIVHLVRWEHAVPKVGIGYYARMRGWRQEPPIVFAGDWIVQPCVEGAVRSGNAAAAIFGPRAATTSAAPA
jgi:protoporphyrinogen oxidase